MVLPVPRNAQHAGVVPRRHGQRRARAPQEAAIPVRIAIVGPESSGKTTLARQLAAHLSGVWVPEVARTWIPNQGPPRSALDLVPLAHAQLAAIAAADAPWVVCDTTVLVLRIWSEVRFGGAHPDLPDDRHAYDLHLLCRPDLPWEPDPLREDPDPLARAALHARYVDALDARSVRWASVEGAGPARLACALAALHAHLPSRFPSPTP